MKHVHMAANVAAGLDYLAAGLASGAVEVAVIRYRREFSRWYIENLVYAAERTNPRWRWIHGTWARRKWRDEEFRERKLVGIWLPGALFMPVLTIVFLGSAVAEFRR